MADIIWLDSEKRQQISRDEMDFIGSGAQGAVYKWLNMGSNYAVKVLMDTNIYARVNEIRARLKDAPESILKRGVPLAYGYARGDEFGIESGYVALLVFNYIEGDMLSLILKEMDEDPFSPKRKNIAKQLLDIFEVIETTGVIHTDAYEDNFFIERERLYISDLEGAGIWEIKKNRWKYKPTVAGKAMIFAPPKELEGSARNPHIRSMTWYGMRMLHKILLGFEPYDFFTAYKKSIMDSEWNTCNKEWPPKPKEPRKCNIDPDKLKFITEIYNTYIPTSTNWGHAFRHLMAKTFGLGYLNPNARPSMKEIYTYIKEGME